MTKKQLAARKARQIRLAVCEVCLRTYQTTRSDSRTCSPKCRKRGSRWLRMESSYLSRK